MLFFNNENLTVMERLIRELLRNANLLDWEGISINTLLVKLFSRKKINFFIKSNSLNAFGLVIDEGVKHHKCVCHFFSQ